MYASAKSFGSCCLSWTILWNTLYDIGKVRLTLSSSLSTPPHTSKSCLRLLRLVENGFFSRNKLPRSMMHKALQFLQKRRGEESQIKRAQAGKSRNWGFSEIIHRCWIYPWQVSSSHLPLFILSSRAQANGEGRKANISDDSVDQTDNQTEVPCGASKTWFEKK